MYNVEYEYLFFTRTRENNSAGKTDFGTQNTQQNRPGNVTTLRFYARPAATE